MLAAASALADSPLGTAGEEGEWTPVLAYVQALTAARAELQSTPPNGAIEPHEASAVLARAYAQRIDVSGSSNIIVRP